MAVAERILKLSNELEPHSCTLIAVSKTRPIALIQEAYTAGHRDFGENKVQDLVSRYNALPQDIRWHMIGHLQRNKVKFIAPFVYLIHSIDTEKLLMEVNKQAGKIGRKIPCLLQIHIAEEETKFGFSEKEIASLLRDRNLEKYNHVKIEGMMGMATFTTDHDQIRREFRSLRNLYDKTASQYSAPNFQMNILSMGMSGDYDIAIDEGSNMVRVGTTIFGKR